MRKCNKPMRDRNKQLGCALKPSERILVILVQGKVGGKSCVL